MVDPIGSANPTNQAGPHAHIQKRRSNVIRKTLFLAAATVALAAFVAGLGDVRRRDWAMSQSRWYGKALSKRLSDQGHWPIDLHVEADQNDSQSSPAKMYKFEWLPAKDAQRLAQADRSILVAWTQLVPQTILPDGRGCVVYESSSFKAVWLSRSVFEKRRGIQQAQ